MLKMYRQLGVELPGKVAVKVHSGEDGNQNFLRPEFMKPVIDAVHGTVVECNTAYGGARNETPKHVQLMKKHGWSDLFDVDIMDAEGPDVVWPVKNGKVLSEDLLGKDIENYDSMLVLIHFKGHPMGGYGGALKQLSIGCASSAGKAYIHSGGKVKDQAVLWENICPQDTFLEAMADAASTVADHFAGKIAYVAVMKNLSVDCDCCAVAENPCMGDIGILSSLDPVALDRACLDLVESLVAQGKSVIVWCIFKRSIRNVVHELHERGITARAISGGTDMPVRARVIDSFKAGETSVLVTNPHTLAESVSLHGVCHDAVYFECSYNLVHLLQSKDRIHRLGLSQEQYTQYHYLRAVYERRDGPWSLDRNIYERLQYKEQVMLDSIDRGTLEPGYTDERDLELVFKGLFDDEGQRSEVSDQSIADDMQEPKEM